MILEDIFDEWFLAVLAFFIFFGMAFDAVILDGFSLRLAVCCVFSVVFSTVCLWRCVYRLFFNVLFCL